MQGILCLNSTIQFIINPFKILFIMMKSFFKKNVTTKKVLTLALVMMALTPMLAQGGATAISNAASDIRDYWDPLQKKDM
jgi:hypothetical protein